MKNENDRMALRGGLTRRDVIAGAVALGAFAFGSSRVSAADDEISHMAEAIHQEPVFQATRQRVYEALMDTDQFAKIVQMSAAVQSKMALGHTPVQISDQPGGIFKIFGGHIIGRQIELVRNERIVQAWRVVDWAPGVYSIVKFDLVGQGPATKIMFDHTGFPTGQAEHLADGWNSNYWEPLAKFLT